jgi:hypothetical protein
MFTLGTADSAGKENPMSLRGNHMSNTAWAAGATAVLIVGFAPVAPSAQLSFNTANDLGALLASEEPCGLAFDQDAIDQFIDEHVDASDMGFATQLSSMTRMAARDLEQHSDSHRRAHCRAMERSARHHGFIE